MDNIDNVVSEFENQLIQIINENPENGEINITIKTEQSIRQKALEEIFGKLNDGRMVGHVVCYRYHLSVGF